MGNTPFYNLFYLEPGTDTADFLDADERRFKTLDSQLYSLYQLFGNGIIEDGTNNNKSWRVETFSDYNKFTQVSITPGKGHVSYNAAETIASKTINLPVLPSGVLDIKVWIYAVKNDFTPVTKDVDFIASLVRIDDTENYINVGGIDVDTVNSTISVFDTDRQVLSLFNSISDIIYRHKHIGGAANPAPIDLSSETTNKLSGENIENLDLSTVTRGKLSANRLPTISHFSLTDKGSLNHSQIDGLLEQYSNPIENYTLSDFSIANRLQTLIALKKQSGFEYIDSTQLNTIVYVPGIWPNTRSNASVGITANFSDYNIPSSLIGATIIDGTPRTSGSGISARTSDQVFADNRVYTSKRDFETAKNYNQANNLGFFENIKISGTTQDDSSGYFTISTPLNFEAIEQPVVNIFNNSSGWYRGINTISNYSGGSVSVDTRLYSYKMFDNPILMNEVSNIGIGFSVGLGTSLSKIGQIYMYLVLGSDTDDPNFTNDVKVTFDSGQYYPTTGPSSLYLSSADGTEIGYKVFDDTTDSASIGSSIYKNIELSNLWPAQFRSSIKGLGFYWSSLKGWNPEKSINFYLRTPNDDQVNPSPYNYDELQIARRSSSSNLSSAIFTWNESLFAGTGKFLFRFDSGNTNTVYNALQWNTDEPSGTDFNISTRTDLSSSLFYDLNNIDYTSNLSSGYLNTNSNKGRYLDVLLTLSSDSTKAFSPSVNDLRILFSSVGTGGTKIYNSRFSNFDSRQTGWDTETYYSKNISFGSTYIDDNKLKNKLIIADTSTVGNWIYLRNNSAISVDLNNNETTYEDGIDANNLSTMLSPVQIYEKSITTGFNKPTDFQQLEDGSNIYCDTGNDRILLFDSSGNLTKVIQGNLRLKQKTRDFVALAGYLNVSARKLWIALSQNISTTSPYDPTRIYIVYDNNTIRIDDTRIDKNLTGLSDTVSGNSATLEITFVDNDLGKALATSISNARNKKIHIESGAFTNGGSLPNTTGIGAGSTSTVVRSTNNSLTYFTQLNSTYAGSLTTSTGLPITTLDATEDLDYNDDNLIPTESLLAPNEQIGDVEIDIYVGPIFFRNIYNPISVHYSNNRILIVQPFENSILCFNDDSELSLNYSIPSDVFSFVDNKLGSVFEIENGLILVGTPAYANTYGQLFKYKVLEGMIEVRLNFEGLDVVKAMPGPNSDNFYVLLDDSFNQGINTRLKLVDSTGNIISTWGENYELIHPKGLKLMTNNDILVSE